MLPAPLDWLDHFRYRQARLVHCVSHQSQVWIMVSCSNWRGGTLISLCCFNSLPSGAAKRSRRGGEWQAVFSRPASTQPDFTRTDPSRYNQRFFRNTSSSMVAMPSITPSKMK
jgi:hypothetical protein